MVTLAQTLASSPENILQQLVESALELCPAQSAGISLLEEENGRKIFRWHALAGQYAPHQWGTTPREFSPCGTVLDNDRVELMVHLDRHFTYFAQVEPRITEALLVPFHVSGEAVGTVWVVAHEETRQFDAEDARVMTTLAEFAAAVYQSYSGALALSSVFATIREPLVVLDGSLRIHSASRSFYETFQVEQRATEGRLFYQLGRGEWAIPELRTLLEDIPRKDSVVENFEVAKDFPSLGHRVMSLNARNLLGQNNPSGLILLAIKDITDRKHSGEQLRTHEDSLRERARLENINSESIGDAHNFKEIVGNSKAMKRVMRQVEVVAPTDATV